MYETFEILANGYVQGFFEERDISKDGFVYSVSQKKYNYTTGNWELTFKKIPIETAKVPL